MKYKFNRKSFGNRIMNCRKEMGLTQFQLSKKTGFSQNTISNWENGNREPEGIHDLVILLNALDLKFEDVIDYED